MIYSLFIGRFQPLHKGHIYIIQKALDEGKNVLIALRRTEKSETNPYNVKQRKSMIRKAFPDKKRVVVISIPDIEEVCYGRNVGWGIREIPVPEDIAAISATKIRKEQNENNSS